MAEVQTLMYSAPEHLEQTEEIYSENEEEMSL